MQKKKTSQVFHIESRKAEATEKKMEEQLRRWRWGRCGDTTPRTHNLSTLTHPRALLDGTTAAVNENITYLLRG